MVNDMRINYAQGSRPAELATVDGAEGSWGGASVSPRYGFIILFERRCIQKRPGTSGLCSHCNTGIKRAIDKPEPR